MRERTEQVLRLSFNLLKLLDTYEDIGKEAGVYELISALNTNYHTLQRILRALESLGYIAIEPREKKNVPKLTDRGRCVAKCLVS